MTESPPTSINLERAAHKKLHTLSLKSRRGSCLCGLIVTDRVKPGVVSVFHGAWFEPENTPQGRIDVHGNANTLTIDVPTSKIARGNTANTANVSVTRWKGEIPPVLVHDQPRRVL